jgi:hypothetical protein
VKTARIIPSEHALQKAVAVLLQAVLCAPYYWTGIDHAGRLSPRQGADRKARGVKKGIADFLVMAPGPRVLWIEMKRDTRAAKQSDEQIGFEIAQQMLGASYVICRSVSDVQAAVYAWRRNELREAA